MVSPTFKISLILLITCDEAGASEGGGLTYDCLPGPDISGGREAASLVTSRGHPQWQTLGVRPVVAETRLRTELSFATPGALHNLRYEHIASQRIL